MATPLEQYKQQYESSQEHQDALKWQNATINDVANKYGFRFDKGYADQQAETIAAAQRNEYNNSARLNQSSNQQALRQIDSDLKDGIVGTEDNFFQQYIQQRQEQANRGINAGLSADQDLRLGMNQQKVMAGFYRDASNNKAKEMDRFNNEATRIQDALAQVEKERLTTAEKLYQELLGQGYNLLGTERSWFNTLDQQRYGKYQDDVNLWYKEQERLAAERAAAEAARQRAAQEAAAKQSALQAALAQFNKTKASQSSTKSPVQSYANNKVIQAVELAKAKTKPTSLMRKVFNEPVSVANNPAISAYSKIKMMGY